MEQLLIHDGYLHFLVSYFLQILQFLLYLNKLGILNRRLFAFLIIGHLLLRLFDQQILLLLSYISHFSINLFQESP